MMNREWWASQSRFSVCVDDDVQALESAMVENIKPWRPLEVTLSCLLEIYTDPTSIHVIDILVLTMAFPRRCWM